MAIAGKFLKIATIAAVLAGSLSLAEPAFARGGFGGGGFHGGGFHGGGWGGRGWGGGGWGGRGWGGGGWGWGGWGWGVPIVVGGAYYYPYYDDPYYGDDYPVARRVYVQPVHRVYHSCIWRRVRVHTCCGWAWRRVRYCAR
ncbi:hypothetical protein [Rhodoblastus sp.]|uniref:hypothetical protein n=1 Tax=Rhodoblastus sp. TaxID=1962975 RepID=UPI003F98ACFD